MSVRFAALVALVILLAAGSCRNEAFVQNRAGLIERTVIRGAGGEISADNLQKTKESYVDLVIGLNTFRHEKRFSTLAEVTEYLKSVTFSGELPKEFITGQNRIVGVYDGTGGWVLGFADDGRDFRLGLNVGDARRQPLQIFLKDK